jgi:Trypsin-co-occurring domain 1
MRYLTEVQLDQDGSMIIAEINDPEDGVVLAGRDIARIAETTGSSVEVAMARVIRPAARVVFEQLSQLTPDAVEIEFGLRFNGKVGAVFASTEAEGHLQVKLSWSGRGPVPTVK